ncbi:heparan-alpha-glucosaminide N-acetyltransferase [Paucibacter sp. R3-3]|uniref:Heparan-alpha-glucosaminide N-acetyltransferase n=1 Tax=Roseateles agri TaxID=3098619 RepID=A0ABU5DJ25_9BURK|nr:heparan-alpha-glucosaminide N-acetyltransferase [Paucibacter sp. R3-3]MDY0746300.1 heparan-alpha-glucosaminide N-acetyltransferase [Paucibacter sp. R3-3]
MIRADVLPAVSARVSARYPRLDALRGLAVVWMAAFHFCFDLNHFGWLRADFYRDPFWIGQRTLIVSSFLLCAGMGQALATAQHQPWPRFWKRWAQIAGCALLVTAGSWWMFPHSFISFGVLHGMAVMLLLMRWAGPRLGAPVAAMLGLVLVLLPQFVQHPFFDTRWTDWVGLVTHKPITEDYVPVLPWLGVMLWGFALLRWRPALVEGALPRALHPLAVLGRWSLSFYMIHQPVLIGLLTLTATMRG